MTDSIYAAKPWISLLSDAQRAPVGPAGTLVHAFRSSVARSPGHPALACFDGRLSYRGTDAPSDSVAGHLAGRASARTSATATASPSARLPAPPYRRSAKPPSIRSPERETVRAYVSLRPGATVEPEELGAYCKERLAAYKYPREAEILAELPKTASGKILGRELRSPR